MQIIKSPISLKELQQLAQGKFGNFVKVVVDIEKEIMAIDGELHADEEALLLDHGSKQTNLWGINLYPEKASDHEFIEFDSVINLRPSQKNFSRGIDDLSLQEKIKKIVERLITK